MQASKIVLVLSALLGCSSVFAAPDADGTIHVPAFDLPVSSFLNEEARAAVKHSADFYELWKASMKACPSMEGADKAAILAIRKCQADAFYQGASYKKVRAKYDVAIAPQEMGGVSTEIFTPAQGVAKKNQQRVLINLHGGGFEGGARIISHLESLPIAALGQIKVVSVDYRMAPDYSFPAASEDVTAVYRELLKTYKPQNIGIYGCSAGGLLTAQAVAWFQRENLPRPGAVGMFCAGGSYYGEGDSGPFVSALTGIAMPLIANADSHPYFFGTTRNDPLVFPTRSDQVLAKFPPSLLISSTRDQSLSSVVHMHSRLVALGVEAQLHVWEGLLHTFFFDPDLPQSREVYDVTVKFFDRHLGKSAAAAPPDNSAAKTKQALGVEVDRFVKADAASPPAACQTLFVGSSSMVMWKTLQQDMAPLQVINRGFGGSQIEYVNLWFNQVVTPYHPRAIVFYAGENDIAAGKSVDRVVADFDQFMKLKTAALGQTPVYFISLKPSKLRFWQFNLQTQVNDAVRARAAQRSDLYYIDVVTPMLQDGKPKDLFIGDYLHMKPEGYALWTPIVKAALTPNTDLEARNCESGRKH